MQSHIAEYLKKEMRTNINLKLNRVQRETDKTKQGTRMNGEHAE